MDPEKWIFEIPFTDEQKRVFLAKKLPERQQFEVEFIKKMIARSPELVQELEARHQTTLSFVTAYTRVPVARQDLETHTVYSFTATTAASHAPGRGEVVKHADHVGLGWLQVDRQPPAPGPPPAASTQPVGAAAVTWKRLVGFRDLLDRDINMYAAGYEWALVRGLQDWFDQDWDANALYKQDDRFVFVWEPSDNWALS